MQYILSIFIFSILTCSTVVAQDFRTESKGTIQFSIGGSLGLNFSNRNDNSSALLGPNLFSNSENTSNFFSLNFSPYLALTTSRKYLFGISPIIGYNRLRNKSVSNNIDSFIFRMSWQLGGEVFFRNYFKLNDRLIFFTSSFISYSVVNTDIESTAPLFFEERTVLGTFGISTGFTFDINEKWKLLTTFWNASLVYTNFNSALLDENQIDLSLSTGFDFSNIRFGVERSLDFSKK